MDANQAGEAPIQKRKMREGTKRTTSGCLTCRIRRVKCDEARPACRNCTSTKRKCDGYPERRISRKQSDEAKSGDLGLLKAALASSTSSRSSRSPTPIGGDFRRRTLAPLPYSSHDEKFAFEHFISGTSATAKQLAVPDFWRLVLQLSTQEPAIRSLCLALGSLNPKAGVPESIEFLRRQSYAEALRGTRELVARAAAIGDDDDVTDRLSALVACVLFTCYETIQFNFPNAHLHVQQGMRIVSDKDRPLLRPQSSHHQKATLKLIFDSLLRSDLELRGFSDNDCPYPFEALPPCEDDLDVPDHFDDIDEALSTMIQLWRVIFYVTDVYFRALVNHTAPYLMTQFSDMKIRCIAAMERWKTAFDALQEAHRRSRVGRSPPDQHFQTSVHLLSVYYHGALMIVDTGTSSLETSWDVHVPTFANILEQVAALEAEGLEKRSSNSPEPRTTSTTTVRLYEMGCIPIIFVTATKCRDPIVRRRAISLLSSMERSEGVWQSRGCARVAQRLIDYEERCARELTGIDVVESAEDVPEEARVCAVEIRTNHPLKRIDLNFLCVAGRPIPEGVVSVPAGHVTFETYWNS